MDMNKIYKAISFFFIGMMIVGVATAVVVNIDGSNLTPLSWFNSNKTVWDAKGNASYPINSSNSSQFNNSANYVTNATVNPYSFNAANATGILPNASIPATAANVTAANVFTQPQKFTADTDQLQFPIAGAFEYRWMVKPSAGYSFAIYNQSSLQFLVYNSVSGNPFYPNINAATGTPSDACFGTNNELVKNPALTCTVSLKKQKLNFTNVSKADVDKLMLLNITKFEFKNQTGKHFGETAEHVAEIYPELARYDNNGSLATYEILEFIPLLIKQNQEQQKQIDSLEARVRTLELTKP